MIIGFYNLGFQTFEIFDFGFILDLIQLVINDYSTISNLIRLMNR